MLTFTVTHHEDEGQSYYTLVIESEESTCSFALDGDELVQLQHTAMMPDTTVNRER